MIKVIVFNHKVIVQESHMILSLRLNKINDFRAHLLQDPSVDATIHVAFVRSLSEVVPVFHLMVQIHLKVVQLSLITEIVMVLFE